VAGTRQPLVAGGAVTLNAAGTGQVIIGPDQGPPNWHVSSIITQTSRPAQAPIPRVQLYLDSVDPQNSLGLSYDGSFGQASGDQDLVRGQHIIAVWTGGQSGDRATITVNGERWS
jgi:hypothetical protein